MVHFITKSELRKTHSIKQVIQQDNTVSPYIGNIQSRAANPLPFAVSFQNYFKASQNIKASPNISFKAQPLYDGPYNNVWMISDFGDETANSEMVKSFRHNLKFYMTLRQNKEANLLPEGVQFDTSWSDNQEKGFLEIHHVKDVPPFSTVYAAHTLHRLGGSWRSENKDIFVHVVDPGVGDGQDRSILITEKHGIYIGPHNGSLEFVMKDIREKDPQEKVTLRQLDFSKIEALDKLSYNEPNYQLPHIFHGRDLFSVAAGVIAAGIDPYSISRPFPASAKVLNKEFFYQARSFSETISSLPKKIGETIQTFSFEDNNYGDLRTNMLASPNEIKQLTKEKAIFNIKNLDTGEGEIAQVGVSFSNVPKGSMLIYLGSLYGFGKYQNKRFVDVAINLGKASQVLNVGPTGAHLAITRIA